MKKVVTITIDTLTAMQDNAFMMDKKSASHDKWKEYGRDIWVLIDALAERGFESILILGEPGTGKTTGMRTLPEGTNIWFNADKKNPNWPGGKAFYGNKFNPKMPYHMIPKTYKEIINHIDEGLAKDMFAEERYAILTGHPDDFKAGGGEMRQRLSTLGKVSTKMRLEGKLETVLYSKVQPSPEGNKYVFETQNNGFNTARSPMGCFDPIIDNDLNFVIQTLIANA